MALSAYIFISSAGFPIKKGQLIAAEIEADKMIEGDNPKADIGTAADYFARQGINTAIFKVNTSHKSVVDLKGFENIYAGNADFKKNDIISCLKKELDKKNIKLYISVDCSELYDDEILRAVSRLNKKYKTDGIVIDNFGGENNTLIQISKVLKKGIRKTDLIIHSYDLRQIRKLAELSVADGYICEKINAEDCVSIKKDTGAKVFPHYNSPSMESDVFILTGLSRFDGAIFALYDKNDRRQMYLNTILRLNKDLPVFDFKVSTDFNVTYPTNDFTTTYKGLYITGTGQPFGSVIVNGQRFTSEKDGTFGIYFPLEEGENTIEISQNGKTEMFTVTKNTDGSKYESKEKYWDDTCYLSRGRVVMTTGELTSILSDPDNDLSIIGGIEKGTKLIVEETAETERNGQKTHAYRLSNKGYVLADKVEVLSEVTSEFKYNKKYDKDLNDDELEMFEHPFISKRSTEKLLNGDEIIEFSVGNMPAVFSDFTDESLTIHFLDAEIADISMPASRFYKDYRIYFKDDGTYIEFVLNGDKRLWGYDISTSEGGVRIYMKSPPMIAQGDYPLKDVTVMLDAGHGGKDSGALGVAALYGPLEKDVNLAVASAVKSLLEQMGAKVVMTREDDSYLTLEQRRAIIRNIKPDLFISVHHNSMNYSYNSTNATGSECYYFTKQSKKFANLMCENIANATGRLNRGSNVGRFYVTRTDIAPSVLMEYSFIINPKDYSTTYTDTDIYKAAFGTIWAILEVIPQK